MPSLSASNRMIASAETAAVAGCFEVATEPRRRPPPEPDPADTVRLPTFERSVRLWPVAHAHA